MARGNLGSASVSIEADTSTFEARVRQLNEELRRAGSAAGDQFGEGFKRGADEASNAARSFERTFGSIAQRSNSAANNLRFGMQNLGFQIQDIVVQLEAGTSPLRVFVQQGSQILGAFGAIGAIAGGTGAVIAVLAAQFLDLGSAAEDSVDQIDSLDDALGRLSRNAAQAGKDLQEAIAQFAEAGPLARGQILAQAENELVQAQQRLKDLRNDLTEVLRSISDPDILPSGGEFLEVDPATLALLRNVSQEFANGERDARSFRSAIEDIANSAEGAAGALARFILRGGVFGEPAVEQAIQVQGAMIEASLEIDRLNQLLANLEARQRGIEPDVISERQAKRLEDEFQSTREAVEDITGKLAEVGIKESEIADQEQRILDLRRQQRITLEETRQLLGQAAAARERELPPLEGTVRIGDSLTGRQPREIVTGRQGLSQEEIALRDALIAKLDQEAALAQDIAETERQILDARAAGVFNEEWAARLLELNARRAREQLMTTRELAQAGANFAASLLEALVLTDNLKQAAALAAIEFARIAVIQGITTFAAAGAKGAAGALAGGTGAGLMAAAGAEGAAGALAGGTGAGLMAAAGPEVVRLGVEVAGRQAGREQPQASSVFNQYVDARGSEAGTVSRAVNAAVPMAVNASVQNFARSYDARRQSKLARRPF